jgi:inorganic pyrophosphatase
MSNPLPSFHPWHHISNEGMPAGLYKSIIEIPIGSKVKYELDKETGLLRLDRVLYSSFHYPVNYGFIPQTLDCDGDPLDILVICSEPIHSLSLVEAKIIGVMNMVDSGDNDDKIIAVANKDISVNYIDTMEQLPPHWKVEVQNFFENYKVLENKKTVIENFMDKSRAIEIINESRVRFKEKFGY